MSEIEEPRCSILRRSNDSEVTGYGIPLDEPGVIIIRDDDTFEVTLPSNVKAQRSAGRLFSFDGLGWSDDTPYQYGSAEWETKVRECDAWLLINDVKQFLSMLPDDAREEAEKGVSVGLRMIQVMVSDRVVYEMMVAAGLDELRARIHSSPFVTFEKPRPEFDATRLIVGPPHLVQQARADGFQTALEIARHLITTAIRRS
jgi:hypothetical protein